MKVSTLAVEAISLLILFSSFAITTASTTRKGLWATDNQRRLGQRSPQAADNGGKKEYQPYDYGYGGASPGEDDATGSNDAETSVTSSIRYSNTTSTSSEPSAEGVSSSLSVSQLSSDSASIEAAQTTQDDYPSESVDASETTVTDEIYQPGSSTTSPVQSTPPEDGYPPQEPSLATRSDESHLTSAADETASLAGISDGPSLSNSTSTTLQTLRPPYSNTTTTMQSVIVETTLTSTRLLGTPGDFEPPFITPSGFPTWTVPTSRSWESSLPPFPSNSTAIPSLPGTGSVVGGEPSETTIFMTSSLGVNSTAHSGTGFISPTVRRTSSDVVAVSSLSEPPFPAGNETSLGVPSPQGTAISASIDFTTTPGPSPSPTITIGWTTLLNATHAPDMNGSAVSTGSDNLTDSQEEEDQTMFPGGWSDSARASSPPFPTTNATSVVSMPPGTGVPGETTLSLAVNETESLQSTPASFTMSASPVPWPVPLPSNQTAVPFPNVTTSAEASSSPSVVLGTGAWTSLSAAASSMITVSVPPGDPSSPPFPLPNSTVSLPPGTATLSGAELTISGTLAITGSASSQLSSATVPFPNTTSLEISHTVVAPPLPPVTFANTTITFPPVTDDPAQPTSMPPPFPLSNATILPIPSQSSGEIFSGLSTSAAWPNSTVAGSQTVSASWIVTPPPTPVPWPTGTVSPSPVNSTLPTNTTEPDHTGTLFDWPMESEEPPFPMSNSTVSHGPTGIPSEEDPSSVSATLIFSHTVTQDGPPIPSQFSSVWANVTTNATGTLIVSQTVIEEDTAATAHGSSTWWQEGEGESTRTTWRPPPVVTPFLNTTTAVNGTGDISGTLLGTPTTTIVLTTTSVEFLDPSTVTRDPSRTTTTTDISTSTVAVTITLGPAQSSSPPCITVTVTHGNVTEKITKTITQPHPDLTGSASRVWGDESMSDAASAIPGWESSSSSSVSSDLSPSAATSPCSTSTKTPKAKTTSCTLSLHWSNDTMTTLSTSIISSSEPGADGELTTISETASMYSSVASASNISFIPVPDPTTLLTSTRDEPVVEPFMMIPTTTVSDEPLPSIADYPWGGEGPLHRHHNISSLGSWGLRSGQTSKRGLMSWLRDRVGHFQARWLHREQQVRVDADGDQEEQAESGWDSADEYDLVDGR